MTSIENNDRIGVARIIENQWPADELDQQLHLKQFLHKKIQFIINTINLQHTLTQKQDSDFVDKFSERLQSLMEIISPSSTNLKTFSVFQKALHLTTSQENKHSKELCTIFLLSKKDLFMNLKIQEILNPNSNSTTNSQDKKEDILLLKKVQEIYFTSTKLFEDFLNKSMGTLYIYFESLMFADKGRKLSKELSVNISEIYEPLKRHLNGNFIIFDKERGSLNVFHRENEACDTFFYRDLLKIDSFSREIFRYLKFLNAHFNSLKIKLALFFSKMPDLNLSNLKSSSKLIEKPLKKRRYELNKSINGKRINKGSDIKSILAEKQFDQCYILGAYTKTRLEGLVDKCLKLGETIFQSFDKDLKVLRNPICAHTLLSNEEIEWLTRLNDFYEELAIENSNKEKMQGSIKDAITEPNSRNSTLTLTQVSSDIEIPEEDQKKEVVTPISISNKVTQVSYLKEIILLMQSGQKNLLANSANKENNLFLFSQSLAILSNFIAQLPRKKNKPLVNKLNFSEQVRNKVAIYEACDHIFNGWLEQFFTAVVKQDLHGLAIIFPNLILGWHTQIEQLMTGEYLLQNGKMHHGHYLIEISKGCQWWDQLSASLKMHLEKLDGAQVWARYPYISTSKESAPEVVHLLAFTTELIQIMQGEKSLNDDHIETLKNIIKFVIERQRDSIEFLIFYSEKMGANAEELSYLNEFSNEQSNLINIFQNEAIRKHSNRNSVSHKIPGSFLSLPHLEKSIRDMEQLIDSEFLYLGKAVVPLQEAHGHLLRVLGTIEMSKSYKKPQFYSLYYRNLMFSVQLIFEQLYKSQRLFFDVKLILTHKFSLLQEALQKGNFDQSEDRAEMHKNIQKFNFEQIYYPHFISKFRDSFPELQYLMELMKNTKAHVLQKKNHLTELNFEENWESLINRSVEALISHIEETLSIFKDKNRN